MAKIKLNLTIDDEVVRNAKEQRVNISKFTERMLKGYVSAKKPRGNVYDNYKQLFDSILPLLKEFDVKVKIARGIDQGIVTDEQGNTYELERPITIFLVANGSFYLDEDDRYFKNIEKIDPEDFLGPKEVLSDLINSLARSDEAKDERLNEILMAKNIIDAMTKRLVKKYGIHG